MASLRKIGGCYSFIVLFRQGFNHHLPITSAAYRQKTHEHTVPHQDMVETSTSEDEGEKNKKRETLIWTHEGNAWHASEYLVGLETDGVFEANRDLPQNTSEIMGVIVSLRYVWLLLSKRQTEMNADCTGMHLLMLLRLVFLSLKCCVSASYSCWQI